MTAALAPTDRQVSFARTLLAERVIPADAHARLTGRLDMGSITKQGLSEAIEWMLNRDRKPVAEAPVSTVVPAGRYALQRDDKSWAFYNVDCPEKGKWAGHVFVKQVTGYVGEDGVRVSRSAKDAILAKIAGDVVKAMSDYGLQIGRCGHCNRTLTNPESIAAGIGPICAGKMGW